MPNENNDYRVIVCDWSKEYPVIDNFYFSQIEKEEGNCVYVNGKKYHKMYLYRQTPELIDDIFAINSTRGRLKFLINSTRTAAKSLRIFPDKEKGKE